MRQLIPFPPRKYARSLRPAARVALRMAAWNAAFIIAVIILIALAGETYFRLTKPFIENYYPSQFIDGVGLIRKPNAEVRHASWRDNGFVISRANRIGFLDREPISPERAAAGCHIAFIGDSYVEAIEVPIADKFHVRLEEMAARELPHLSIATQAYGLGGTGQINQLPFYDEYARRLNPNMLVLIFFLNDYFNNITVKQAALNGVDPNHWPLTSVYRNERGALQLRPPDPNFRRFMLPRLPNSWYVNAWLRLADVSYFAKWIDEMAGISILIVQNYRERNHAFWATILAERPCCASVLKVWRPGGRFEYEDLREHTAFAIDQFKRRTDRDGVTLLIMAVTDDMGTRGAPQFDILNSIAEPLGIPVISEYDYILRQGYDHEDGLLPFNSHWNAVGHQWAAEAVLEWLKANQDVCD